MQITLNFRSDEIEKLNNISSNQSLEVYLEQYIRSKILNKKNEYSFENAILNKPDSNKFKLLFEYLNKYNIGQRHIAEYFNISQPAVSRFLNSMSTKSSLYNKLFLENSSLKDLLILIYVHKITNDYLKNFNETNELLFKEINDKKLILILKGVFLRIKEEYPNYSNFEHLAFTIQYKIETIKYVTINVDEHNLDSLHDSIDNLVTYLINAVKYINK